MTLALMAFVMWVPLALFAWALVHGGARKEKEMEAAAVDNLLRMQDWLDAQDRRY